eukprot:TRINITY_DN2409_c0_g1_i1.p1 TRINITY_DN2409_c0_g1~~TRINITY_DN2409_c0_g1_i1.p1  ORF type:complete len:691 (-),score=170.80 TRINITY_DN2409_c0_g1_i1:51-2003(-)
MQGLSFLSALGHELLLLSISFQSLLVVVLLISRAWHAWCKWRAEVAFSAALVPSLEALVPLPPPSPALMWAVRWDLDLRAMVNDLKSEGPAAVDRYCENEAFMLKLRKIIRNVVPQSEMDRITEEVKHRAEVERIRKLTVTKTVEEENEDAKAWAAMMREMTGQTPTSSSMEVDVGMPHGVKDETRQAFEGDDAAAWEAMMSVMNRKPGDSQPSQQSPAPVEVAAPSFEGEDAAAWEAMMSVMNRKPGDSQPSQQSPAAVEESAPSFEGEDAAAWEAMMSVMNRKPGDSQPSQQSPAPVEESAPSFEGDDAAALEAMMSVMHRKPGDSQPSQQSPAAVEESAPSFEGDDAAALEAMMSVMHRKPGDGQPSQQSPAAVEESAPSFEGDDAAALEVMMSVMNRKPGDSQPSQLRPVPVEVAVASFEGDDAAALEAIMPAVSRTPCDGQPSQLSPSAVQVFALDSKEDDAAALEAMMQGGHQRSGDSCSSTCIASSQVAEAASAHDFVSDDFADFWALEELEDLSLEARAWQLVTSCFTSRQTRDDDPLPEELALSVQHFFIGDSDEPDSQNIREDLDDPFVDFWDHLDQMSHDPASLQAHASKLVDLCASQASMHRSTVASTLRQELHVKNMEADLLADFWADTEPELAGKL